MADTVTLVEVGPRDGLQNEPHVLSVAQKVGLIERLAQAGCRRIEVGSFVSPKWVPQMADTGAVLGAIHTSGTSVLVPNMRGMAALRAAVDAGAHRPEEVAVFVAASEGFSKANLNCSVADSLQRLAPVVRAAVADGYRVRGYVSCVTDCPYDGPTPPARVAQVVDDLAKAGVWEISLGDTIGTGRPEQVDAMLRAVACVWDMPQTAGHFHDTSGRAIDNITVCLDHGMRVFDTSIAGLGGCPYAPGAPGNVATEVVHAWLCERGYDTGLETQALQRAAAFARDMVHA